MKNLVRFLLMTVFALCLCVPSFSNKVEAANIVVLPMINNVDYPEIEAAYYDNVVDCIKQQNVYEMVDNDAITAIIDKNVPKGKLPDLAAMQKISEAANADLVVIIELDKLSYEPGHSRNDDIYELNLEGTTVSYNVQDGKLVTHPFGVREDLDYGYYVRTNVPIKFWSNTVQHEMHKVLNYKGVGWKKQNLGGAFK